MPQVKLEKVKEDATECWLFPRPADPDGLSNYMEDLLAQVRAILADYTKTYIWHKDSFDVFLPIVQNDELPPHLYSLTFYGDNIEDEWFIVYLLLEVSKKVPGLVVQVRDNDGEFLLIEAANALPAWATPDSTLNRVFIVNGEVHLVPPTLYDVEKNMSVKEGLQFIMNNPDITKAADGVQSAVKNRILGYPQRITESLHCAIVNIPAKYAAILKIEPSLIAQAVNSYCNRDTMETNICKQIVYENYVDTTVTFTKCLYAMLTHASIINKPSWKLPAKSSKVYKKSTLGAKIACGFEILISKASQDTFAGKQWQVYLESLKKNGYFKENIEGSIQYTNLLEGAKNYFLSNECLNINAHIGHNIQQMFNTNEFKNLIDNIELLGIAGEEDSDEWLNINPEELNNFMSEHYGKKGSCPKEEIISPQTITKQLSSFLQQSSDLDGIEVNNEDDHQHVNCHDDSIEFDYDQFTEKVKNILDLIVPEDNWNLDSGTDLSEYGSDDDFKAGVEGDEYQQTMDKELSTSTLSQSFATEGKEVNLTKNTYVNILQSVKEEMGSSGPSSNILTNIGIGKQSIQHFDSDDEEVL